MDQFNAIPKEALPHEWELMKKYSFSETKIPAKYREMIGLAVAASIKCPYCVHFHTRAAKMNGATDEELKELAILTRFTTGWSSIGRTSRRNFPEVMRETSSRSSMS